MTSTPTNFASIHEHADRTRPHSNQMYRGAYRVTRASLCAFQRMFDAKAGPDPAVTWQVFTGEGEPKTFRTLEQVLSQRNPKGNPIWAIYLEHSGREITNRLFITSADIKQYAAIEYSADGESADEISSLVGRVQSETRNIRMWYWPIRWAHDWSFFYARKYGKAIVVTLAIVFFSILLLGAIGQVIMELSRSAETQSQMADSQAPRTELRPEPPQLTEEQKIAAERRLQELREKAEARAEANRIRQRQESLRNLWQALVLGGEFGVVLLMVLLARFLYPRAIFEIGEGKERHQSLCKVRNFLLGTFLLCSIVIPIALSYGVDAISADNSAKVVKTDD